MASGGEQGYYLSIISLCARCVLLVCQIYHGVVPRPKNLSPKGFLNGLSNPLLIYKKAVTPNGVTAFFWRRARDSNPRTGYSPLHDFQHIRKSEKILDLQGISVFNISIFISPILNILCPKS